MKIKDKQVIKTASEPRLRSHTVAPVAPSEEMIRALRQTGAPESFVAAVEAQRAKMTQE